MGRGRPKMKELACWRLCRRLGTLHIISLENSGPFSRDDISLTLSGVTVSTGREGGSTRSIGEALVAASESDPVVVSKVPGLLGDTGVRLVNLTTISIAVHTKRIRKIQYIP